MSIIVRSNDSAADAQVNESPKAQAEAPESKEPKSAQADHESDPHQEEAQDSDPSGDEAKEKEGHEDAEEDGDSHSDEEGDEASAAKDDKPKKKGGFQRRIDKLNARFSAAQQEVDYWKQQALKSASDSKKTEPELAAKPLASSEGKPDIDKFDTHAEYVEALTDWKTEQKLKEREAQAERSKLETEQQKLVREHHERVKSFADKTEDYAEVLEDVNDVRIPAGLQQAIVESDRSAELIYELAKNRAELERISKLPPLAAARELGKFESKLPSQASSEDQKTEKKEPKKITQAPKPIAPVGTGGKGSAPKSIYDPNLSQSEYERLRREQDQRKNKRA